MRGTPEQSPLSEEHAPNRKSGAPADASSCAPRSAEAAHITRVLSDLLMWAGAEPVGFVTLRRPDQRAWLMLFVKRNPGPVPQEGIAVPGLPCGELPDHEYPPCATFATQMPLNRRRFSVPYSKRAHHLAQIIHTGGWLGLDGGWAAERLVILGSGYDGGPAGGPVTGGSTGPGVSPFVLQGWLFAGQGACGRAVIRAQALAMASAQGQVAGIFSRRGGRRGPASRPYGGSGNAGFSARRGASEKMHQFAGVIPGR